MRRVILISLAVVVFALSGYIAVELITKPKDVDVRDCKTRCRDGRIVSVRWGIAGLRSCSNPHMAKRC